MGGDNIKSVTISGISLPFTTPVEEAFAYASRLLGKPSDVRFNIVKKSLDARRNNDIRFVYTVRADIPYINIRPSDGVVICEYTESELEIRPGSVPMPSRPVIVGFGPAGMFAGLLLAREGHRPVILEKGADVDTRITAVERFWHTGELDLNSNVQFGEGGAGTFSDGKLTTRINDSRCGYILREMCKHGAPDEVMFEAKPHIGTDRLRGVVKSIRQEIISLGGEVRFKTSLTGIRVKDGKVRAISTDKGDMDVSVLILAPGHSARGLFEMLGETGVEIAPKPFSVGLRIEHPQQVIDKALYGNLAGHPLLPSGEYQLSYRHGDRTAYTFCMCPGGVVVPAASEEGMVVTNGMSTFQRDGKNANSALVVPVDERDFAAFGQGVFGGIALQRHLERRAFEAGRGNFTAPVQTVDRFLAGRPGFSVSKVVPTYACGFSPGSFDEILPHQVTGALREALQVFGRKLKGFDMSGAILTGVETRTSSPVRIVRNANMESVTARGLYPCGEGAGYAGGIVSAAVDGLRVAMAVMSVYAPCG